jgi:hypothetical protein
MTDTTRMATSNMTMAPFPARRIATQSARPPALEAAYDMYSVAIQQYQKILKLVDFKLHPAPVPLLLRKTDIGVINKRTEILKFRCSKLHALAAAVLNDEQHSPPHRRVLRGPPLASMPRNEPPVLPSADTAAPNRSVDATVTMVDTPRDFSEPNALTGL